MASKKRNKTLKIKLIAFVVLVVVCAVALVFTNPIEKAFKIGPYTANASVDVSVVNACDLRVHYINMGQADATLIELPDGTKMLIDAGNSKDEDGTGFFAYLEGDLNITTLDYLILTHCDQDHVGLMPEVLQKFEVKNIYRPFQIACSSTGTAIEEEDLKGYVNQAKNATNLDYCEFIRKAYVETYTDSELGEMPAKVFVTNDAMTLGTGAIVSTDTEHSFTVNFYAPLAITGELVTENNKTIGKPVKSYTENNNGSPIILLTYLGQKFLFTGDAEGKVENDFLTRYENNVVVKNAFANIGVYQAGHHGSDSSSKAKFLAFINPTYTVVSCGKNNSYNHPSPDFVQRWKAQIETQGVNRKQDELLRTDINETIIFGVQDDGTLCFVCGVNPSKFILRWSYIVGSFFIIGSLAIIFVKINHKNGVKTAENIYKATKKAKKISKR